MKLYSEDNMKEIRKILEAWVLHKPEVTTKLMFGCPSYKVKNTLFGFLVTEGMVLTKLPTDDRENALQIPGADFFKHGKHVMKTWVRVPLKGLGSLPDVMTWLWKSYEHAKTLSN